MAFFTQRPREGGGARGEGAARSSGGRGSLWRAVRHLEHLTVCATIFFQFPRMADAARGTRQGERECGGVPTWHCHERGGGGVEGIRRVGNG